METETTNKTNTKKEWFIFIILVVCSLFFFFGGVPWAGIIWGLGAAVTYPNEKYRAWVNRKIEQLKSISKNALVFGFVILLIFGIFWLIGTVFSSVGGIGEYEGENAEYWFNAYDEENARAENLESKLEEYQYALEEANDNIEQANSDIDSAKWYSGESYGEMVDALDSLDTISTVSEPY